VAGQILSSVVDRVKKADAVVGRQRNTWTLDRALMYRCDALSRAGGDAFSGRVSRFRSGARHLATQPPHFQLHCH
jgi:hypothetical protein